MSQAKIEAFYAKEGPFKEGKAILRELAMQTELEEKLKWGAPVYTMDNKNVLGITAFKTYFGIWFFNGCYLKDPAKVLENAQEGKTMAMRHWKFTSADDIEPDMVLAYMKEAVENQKKGLVWTSEKKKKTKLPPILQDVLRQDPELNKAFMLFTPYKQREFCEYIETAKQESTKLRRMDKIIPMIREGTGINDKYRKA